jgi:hypothetical protein
MGERRRAKGTPRPSPFSFRLSSLLLRHTLRVTIGVVIAAAAMHTRLMLTGGVIIVAAMDAWSIVTRIVSIAAIIRQSILKVCRWIGGILT